MHGTLLLRLESKIHIKHMEPYNMYYITCDFTSFSNSQFHIAAVCNPTTK